MGKASNERKLARLGALGLSGWIVGGVAAACSGGGEFTGKPDEGGPDASLDSGSGGAPGSGGASTTGGSSSSGGTAPGSGATSAGGAGATTPVDAGKDGGDAGNAPRTCVRDEDCRPFICNGTPTCMDGVCGAGDPCEPVQALGCVNECVRTATGASCVVMGADEDGDGHRDARCQANPGDDCDDTVKERHGGATEVCDGVDNDCNNAADSFDGLPLVGSTRVIAPLTNTARLALIRRTSGYALLTVEMRDLYAGVGDPTEVRLLGFDGAPGNPIPITGSLNMNDPAIAAVGDDLTLFGYLLVDSTNVLTMTRTLSADGVLSPPLPANRAHDGSQVWGRAIAPLPSGSGYVLVWDELTASTGSISYAVGTPSHGPQTSASFVYNLPPNTSSRAMRPSVVVTPGNPGFATAWVERVAANADEITANVHLTPKTGTDYVIDSYRFTATPLQYQGEAIKPQLAFDGAAFTVASREPGDYLRVTRANATGGILCRPTRIEGVKTWGAAGSMVNTKQGVLLAVTATNGDVVIYRVAQNALGNDCDVQRTPPLNAPTKRVASSVAFETNQLKVSVGDPVILVGKDDELLVSWVERDRTREEAQAVGVAQQIPAEPNRVVLRTLKPNLCD